MKKLLLALALTSACAAHATPVTVDYKVLDEGGGIWSFGSFVGSDSNNDGLLSFSELVSFTGSHTNWGSFLALPDLVDTGDFNIAQNRWLANGISWIGYPNNAFFTWNSRNNSVNSTWARVTTTLKDSAPVSAPTTLGLLAMGWLAIARRRKTAI